MPEIGLNPFQPGRGMSPPLLAGREAELAAAERCFVRLLEGRSPPRDLSYYGPRGNGKTALLLEIEHCARKRDFRTETLPMDALTDRAGLVRTLQERTGALAGQVTGPQTARFGASAAPRQPTAEIERLFAAWLGNKALRPLVLVVDEAQVLAPEAARPFFVAVQRAKSGPVPFLLVCAGTPDAPRRIRQAGAFNERGFTQCRVGRLDRSATLAALREPAQASGRPFADDAAGFVAEQSQDYPYFIQLLGGAAWEAAAEGAYEISLRDAQAGAAECAEDIAEFYEGRYQEARARGVAAALRPLAHRFAAQEGRRLTESQLETLLRCLGDDPAVSMDGLALEQELSDLGVVWSVRAGAWEMGIPSFADYLLRRR